MPLCTLHPHCTLHLDFTATFLCTFDSLHSFLLVTDSVPHSPTHTLPALRFLGFPLWGCLSPHTTLPDSEFPDGSSAQSLGWEGLAFRHSLKFPDGNCTAGRYLHTTVLPLRPTTGSAHLTIAVLHSPHTVYRRSHPTARCHLPSAVLGGTLPLDGFGRKDQMQDLTGLHTASLGPLPDSAWETITDSCTADSLPPPSQPQGLLCTISLFAPHHPLCDSVGDPIPVPLCVLTSAPPATLSTLPGSGVCKPRLHWEGGAVPFLHTWAGSHGPWGSLSWVFWNTLPARAWGMGWDPSHLLPRCLKRSPYSLRYLVPRRVPIHSTPLDASATTSADLQVLRFSLG